MLVKLPQQLRAVQVLDWFPCVFFVAVVLPLNEVLVLVVLRSVVDDPFDFIFVCALDFYVCFEWGVWWCWFQECYVKNGVDLHVLWQ